MMVAGTGSGGATGARDVSPDLLECICGVGPSGRTKFVAELSAADAAEAKNSAVGRGRARGGGEPGIENPTTDEAGRTGLEVGVEVAPASQDANDLFKTGVVDATTGAGAGVGAGADLDAVDKFSPKSGCLPGTSISRCVVPSGG